MDADARCGTARTQTDSVLQKFRHKPGKPATGPVDMKRNSNKDGQTHLPASADSQE